MFTGPRFEHLLVNSALLLLVGLPLEMTHGCGRIFLVFVPGFFLYYISRNGSGAQNADGRLPYLFIGVLGASLVYSLSKPCGSLVGYFQTLKLACLPLKDFSSLPGWLFCWGVRPHHGPLGHHRPQLARRLARSEVIILFIYS